MVNVYSSQSHVKIINNYKWCASTLKIKECYAYGKVFSKCFEFNSNSCSKNIFYVIIIIDSGKEINMLPISLYEKF